LGDGEDQSGVLGLEALGVILSDEDVRQSVPSLAHTTKGQEEGGPGGSSLLVVCKAEDGSPQLVGDT
jgi:hypothetical protein